MKSVGFFKAYDMRGTFGVDFNANTVYRVGRALPSLIARLDGVAGRRPRILVGRDGRTTSETVRNALVAGLVEGGAVVSDLGLCTTSMAYYFTAADGYDGSAMITASHNPPTDNGIKVSMRTALPVGYATGLDEVERIVSADTAVLAPGGSMPSAALVENVLPRYVEWQKAHRGAFPLEGLRFAVDCSNGMSSLLVHEMFPSAVILNDEIDGRFPCHSPNPLKAEAREQLSAVVQERGLDCGVIFDGDADRAMFVDENGAFVQPDYLIPVVARAPLCHQTNLPPNHPTTLPPYPKAVLHDVRTSRGAIETLRESGFEPVMVPVGHAFAKPKMRELGALCGGELAGHYYFGDFFGCDSGVLAASRVLSAVAEAKSNGETFSAMMRPIVSRYANSGELNFRVEEKEAAIDRVLKAAESFGAVEGRSDMDGVRLEFEDGWINVRKSNTEPYLRLVAEHRSVDGLRAWTSVLEAAINGR